MSRMIQIRNVPDRLHRRLKARAAEAGMSLSDYLLREIGGIAELPTWAEITEQLSSLPPVRTSESAVEVIRAVRDASDQRPLRKGESAVEIIRATRDAGDRR